MTILCDWQIKDYIRKHRMIDPAVLQQVRDINGEKIVSYGLSSVGYDVRLGKKILCPDEQYHADPHKESRWGSEEATAFPFLIGPGAYVLGVTVERFKMPSNIVGICYGKSTYARLGILVNVTPLEPGWEGYLTLEIHNVSTRHVAIHHGQGIAQIMFHRVSEPDVTYADRAGKYQNQPAHPVPPKL